jgi:beta-lactamase regulating signal transducer with metallopeptidase domain
MTLPSLLTSGTAHSWNVSLVLLLIKATLILIAALGITLTMQRASAGARHLVWLVTLGALALIPVLTAWGPLRLEILPAPQEAASDAASRGAVARATIATPGVSLGAPTDANVENAPASSGPSAAPNTSTSSAASVTSSSGGVLGAIRNASAWSLLLAVWGVVALAIVVSLSWSANTVRRLVRRSRPLDDQSWINPLYEVSDRLGLSEPPRLLLSHDAKMPFACGLLHPTIVLPAECETWSQERRLAVLLHELAHVRRHDMLGHTLGRMMCAAYWFHPLVWTAARQLRSESERACDDLALACGTHAADYAEHLLDIVTSVRRDGTPMVALAMARRKEFEGRMLAILDPELRHSTPSRRQSASLIATLAVISVVVGAAAPAPKRAPTSARASATERQIVSESRRPSVAPRDSIDRNSRESSPMVVLEHKNTRLDTRTQVSMQVIDSKAAEKTSGKTAERAAERTSEMLINRGVATAVSADTRSAIDKAMRIVLSGTGAGAGNGAGKTVSGDDRPALLAKVLRTDTSASLRRVAAWGLHEFAEQNVAAEALAAALRNDRDDDVREMSAWALGEGNDLTVTVEALRHAVLNDKSVAVRRTAAWALGHVGDEGGVSTLVSALRDADATVRSRAIWAIGSIEPSSAPKPLVAMLTDKDAHVRELTAWALYKIEDPSAAPALETALRAESDKDVQLSYIRAIASLGEKSVDALRDLLESPDPRIKSMAVHALAGGRATGPWPRPMPQPRPFP